MIPISFHSYRPRLSANALLSSTTNSIMISNFTMPLMKQFKQYTPRYAFQISGDSGCMALNSTMSIIRPYHIKKRNGSRYYAGVHSPHIYRKMILQKHHHTINETRDPDLLFLLKKTSAQQAEAKCGRHYFQMIRNTCYDLIIQFNRTALHTLFAIFPRILEILFYKCFIFLFCHNNTLAVFHCYACGIVF